MGLVSAALADALGLELLPVELLPHAETPTARAPATRVAAIGRAETRIEKLPLQSSEIERNSCPDWAAGCPLLVLGLSREPFDWIGFELLFFSG